MHNLIALQVGIDKQRIKVNSCTKFAMNLRDIYNATTIYSCKKDQTSVTVTG